MNMNINIGRFGYARNPKSILWSKFYKPDPFPPLIEYTWS